MSEPAWAQPGRQYVPSHIQPGSTWSSFAKPDSYNLPQQSSPQAASPGTAAQKPTSPTKHRLGFASRQKSRTARSGSSEAVAEDELPPTLSIRSAPGQNLDLDADLSLASLSSASKPELKSRRHKPYGVAVMVFGFPPGSTAEVLQFFGKLGEIIDNSHPGDLTTDKAAAQLADRSNSIECGRNWLRITFKDRQSAQAALAQNGHIMPGQYVIGCVLAETSEATAGMTQSSTNSLLLDDSELSFVQEQSMASLETSDKTNSVGVSPGSGVSNGVSGVSGGASNASGASNVSGAASRNAARNAEKTVDESSLGLNKIVPLELSGSALFKEPPPNKSLLSELLPKATEFTTTPAPNAKPADQSLAGRVLTKVTDLLFGWDV